MAPSLGKLICNNKDALHQRDEDTATMMEMILQKRNDSILDSERHNHTKTTHQEEILEIAEAIRELAVKLQTRRERFNGMESNPELNASLTRSLEHIQKSIVPTSRNVHKKEASVLVQQNLLDSYSRLKSSQDEEWLIDIVTPKAGNLSLLEEKTPLHSNISRNLHSLKKDRLVPNTGSGMYRTPYPLTSNKPVAVSDTTQPRCIIDNSLVTLRNELAKAKTMEYHNENHIVKKKQHHFSTKNQRSVSRPRNDTSQSLNRTNLIIDATSKPFGKIRSLSTGRAAQHGKQIINRILRRETLEDNTDEKTLTATSSDSTHESMPLSRRDTSTTTTQSDAKTDIIVNRHHKSIRRAVVESDSALDQRQTERNHIFRRSSTPKKHVTEQTTSINNQRQIRPTTPFRSLQPSQPRRQMTIDASMSNVSMTSGYIASDTDQHPIKDRTVKHHSEKGFEIFKPEGAKKHTHIDRTARSSSSENQNRSRDRTIDRVAISQRLQHHQNSIKEKIRKDLNVTTTDLGGDSTAGKISINTTTIKSTTSSTNIDSTRAIIMRHDTIMNDITTKSTTSSRDSSNSSSTGDANTTTAVKKRSSTAHTKPRRTIIRE